MGDLELYLVKGKSAEKKVATMQNFLVPMEKTFKIKLSAPQAEDLVARGFQVYYHQIKSEHYSRPYTIYYAEVNTEDLLKLIPRV